MRVTFGEEPKERLAMSSTVGFFEPMVLLASGNNLPFTLEVFTSLSPAVALGLSVWVGIRQNQIQKKSVKVQQFERRWTIYKKLLDFIQLAHSRDIKDPNPIIEFEENTMETEFLFNDEKIQKLRKDAISNARQILDLNKAIDGLNKQAHDDAMMNPPKDRSTESINRKKEEKVKELDETCKWFGDKLQGLNQLFEPYLKVKT